MYTQCIYNFKSELREQKLQDPLTKMKSSGELGVCSCNSSFLRGLCSRTAVKKQDPISKITRLKRTAAMPQVLEWANPYFKPQYGQKNKKIKTPRT
jgi:hypothetical protein